MAVYRLYFRESVERDLRSIPRKDMLVILQRIKSLATDPRPPGVEKLTGQDRYRLRQGHYRILYSILDHELSVWIVKVGHRKDVYR
jgi:mRNA interferase RelE/StbE